MFAQIPALWGAQNSFLVSEELRTCSCIRVYLGTVALAISAHMIAVEDNEGVWRCVYFRELVDDATNLTINPCQT